RRGRDQRRALRGRALRHFGLRLRRLPDSRRREDRDRGGTPRQRSLLVRLLGAGLQPEARGRGHDRARRLRRRGCGARREGDLLRVLPGQGAEGIEVVEPGASGGVERYCSVCCMIALNAGAATTPPQIAPRGSSTVTSTTTRGRVAGAKPTNEATYLDVE